MTWSQQTVYVKRIEDVMLEVRELKDRVSWRVIDGHYERSTGDLVEQGQAQELTEAQGQCMDCAITFLDKVSPR